MKREGAAILSNRFLAANLKLPIKVTNFLLCPEIVWKNTTDWLFMKTVLLAALKTDTPFAPLLYFWQSGCRI